MGYNFLPCDRNQAYLLPPLLTDRLPQDHLAWFVPDAVEQIDLSQFYKKYRADGLGNSAFQPSMTAALLTYSCCAGVCSDAFLIILRSPKRFKGFIGKDKPGVAFYRLIGYISVAFRCVLKRFWAFYG